MNTNSYFLINLGRHGFRKDLLWFAALWKDMFVNTRVVRGLEQLEVEIVAEAGSFAELIAALSPRLSPSISLKAGFGSAPQNEETWKRSNFLTIWKRASLKLIQGVVFVLVFSGPGTFKRGRGRV